MPGIFRPRGFGGGYDSRWAKEFQSGTSEGVTDPNATVGGVKVTAVRVRPHATASRIAATHHALSTAIKMKQHAEMSAVRMASNG